MIISRLISFVLRGGEFISGAIALGISAYFIDRDVQPTGRIAYTLAINVLATLLAIIWLIPTTGSMINFGTDLFIAAGLFAAFGIQIHWTTERINCTDAPPYRPRYWAGFGRGICGQWKAIEAFTFIGAIFWLASALLSLWVAGRVRRRATTSRV